MKNSANNGIKNIVEYLVNFKLNNMQLTAEQKQDIQTIMNDAKDWRVEKEVEKKAKKYISEGHDVVDAYHFAFEDCTNL